MDSNTHTITADTRAEETDSDQVGILLPDGTRLGRAAAAERGQRSADQPRRPGAMPRSGQANHLLKIETTIPEDLYLHFEQLADGRHVPVSTLAWEALEAYAKTHPR